MERLTPTAIEAADLGIALDPAIGGEAKVFASYDPWINAGVVTQPAENSGVLALESTFQPGTARDFQVVVDRTGARSDSELSLTLAVTFDDNTNGQAKATFLVPDRSANQTYNMGQGTAVDLIGLAGGATKSIKAINSVVSVAGGAVNNRFRLVAIPPASSYFLIGCTDEAKLQLPITKSLNIPCGLNATAFVKSGRSEPGMLTAGEKYVDYAQGLGRINGHFCSAMVEIKKDERVLVERICVGKWKPSASPEIGDGDNVTKMQAAGNFETFAILTAQ